jgi:hypothetical protein
MLDVAVVHRDANESPELLVVEPDDATSGSIKVGLFHRVGEAWQIATGTVVHVDSASQPVLSAWLVDLGGGRFALLSPATAGSTTDIVILRVVGGGPSDLEVGEPDRIGFAATDAGAADVDGDGDNELVVARSPDETCSDTTIMVYPPDRLEADPPREWTLQNRRLAGAAIGEFDGQKGADLLAHTYDNCAVTDLGELHHLTAIRLHDGEPIADLASPDVQESREPLGAPVVIDVDADGQDEAIVRTGGDLAVVDPSAGWALTTMGVGDAIPMAVLGAPTRVLWVSSRDSLRPAGIATIERRRTSLDVLPDVGYTAPDAIRGRLGDAYERASVRAGFVLPPPAAVLDLDADACPEILVPFVVAPCRGLGALEPGPAWLATVPLMVYAGEGGPTLLTALGLDWRSGGGPVDPSPAAAGPAGAWRHGPSARFSLAEVPSQLVLAHPTSSPPTIDGTVAPNGFVTIGASRGARVLVQVRPIGTAEAIVDDPAPLPADFLAGPTDGSGTTFMIPPIEVHPNGSSPDGATASFDIRSLPSSDGSRLDRWMVDVAQLDALGDLAGPARVAALFDDTAPALAVDAPLLSPVWPLQATLRGSSEAGAKIRVGAGVPVVADAHGAFAIDTPLAPWPQPIELTAADAYGNATTATVSAMGGVDVRQLPWVPIVSVSLLLAALVTSLRGVRRGRPVVAPGTLATEEQAMPEIEELSTSGFRHRD